VEKPLVEFLSCKCWLKVGRYSNGRVALELVVNEPGPEYPDAYPDEPMATCTVNLPHVELAPDEVLIKDYSENAGMLEALTRAKIVEPTGRTVATGFVEVPVCRLLIAV